MISIESISTKTGINKIGVISCLLDFSDKDLKRCKINLEHLKEQIKTYL